MNIRRSSDNTTANFYDDGNGSLITATGQEIKRWLGAATTQACVTIWYDQSGQERNATQITNANQPVYNPHTKNIVFDGSNDCFSLPNDTFPSGNTSVTVVVKHDFLDVASVDPFLSAGTTTNNNLYALQWNPYATSFQEAWYNNDIFFNPYTKGAVITSRYDNTTGRIVYMNGVQVTSSASTARNTTAVDNFIGFSKPSWHLKGELKSLYIFSSALSHTDQYIVENTNVWMPYSTYIYAPPNYYGMSLYLDASRTDSYSGTGTTWTDLSGCGNNMTLTNCTFVNNTIRFDGSTSFALRSTYNLPPSSAMTLIAWVYVRGNYSGRLATISRNSGNASNAFAWGIDTFFDFGSSAGFTVQPNARVLTPGWYQMCFAKSSGTYGAFYLNGRPNGTFTALTSVTYNTNDFCIGKDFRDNNNFLNGDIATFMVCNYGMSSLEILQNFNDNQSRFLTPSPPLAQTAIFSQLSSTALSACRTAYAFRLVNPRYTGFCVEVRRASDNTLQNFYADVNGNLTTGPFNTGININTFISGTTGFVKTWYDQSGLAKNLTQTTNATQPQIFPAAGDDTYIYLLNQRGMSVANVFATSTISNMHAIFSSRTISSSQNFLINFNGNNGSGGGERIFIHAPWGPENLWYWAPGNFDVASATAITSLRQRVSVSIYKSTVENKAGMRLNQGTRYLSGANAQNVSVAAGMTLNGIPTGSAGADHYFYGLYVFGTRLPAQDESLLETSLMPFTNNPPNMITQGLVLWLDMSVSRSYPGTGNTIYDLSGLNNHFTMTSGTSGFTYNQLGFMNISTMNATSSSFISKMSADFTIEVVCRPTSNNTQLFALQNDTNAERFLNVTLPFNNQIGFNPLMYDTSDFTTNALYYTPTNISTAARHYVFRCRMDATPNRQIFENTIPQIDSGTNRTIMGLKPGNIAYMWKNQYGNQWAGDFYYIRVYNRALTDAEIFSSYTAAQNRYNLTQNYFTNNPFIPGTVYTTGIVWTPWISWTGFGTPSWLCESSPHNQSAVKRYEFFYLANVDTSVRFQFQADNSCTVSVNNTQIGSNNDWTITTTVSSITLKSGWNRIVIVVTNDDPGGNGGVILSCSRMSDNQVLFVTDNRWRMN
jgi:hypothetical protein